MASSAKTMLLKTQVGVDGEQTYKEALKNINRELTVLKSEMKATTSAFGDNQNSVEALTAKQEALSRQQEMHIQKVQRLSEVLELAKTKYADNHEVQGQCRIDLANAQAALNKCTTELNGVNTALESATQAQEEAAESTDDAQKAREQETEALKKVSNAIMQYDAQLRGLKDAEKDIASDEAAEKLELLHKKLDAQDEQVALLTRAYEQAKEETGEYSDETTKLYQSLENARQAQAETNRSIAEMDEAYADAEKSAGELTDSTEDAAEATEDMGEETEEAAEKSRNFASVMAGAAKTLGGAVVAGAKAAAAALVAVGSAAAAAVKAGFDLSVSAGQYADDVGTLSVQTGISADALQRWTYNADLIDTSVDTITGSMTKMIRNMDSAASGSETAAASFAALGVDVLDVNGRLRGTEDVFWDAIDALGQISNETERDALAMDLFGKSAQDLNPLIEAGSAAWKELGDEAQQLGTVFSDEELATMGGFDDTMNKAKRTAEGLKNAIGLVLIPAFQPLVSRATSAMAKVSLALRDGVSPDEVSELVDGLLDEAEAAMGDVVTMIENTLPLASSALGKLVSSLGKKLPGMVQRILPHAMELLQGVLNAITSNASEIGRVAGELVGQLASFLVTNLPSIVSAAWSLVKGLFSGLSAAIGPTWETVKDTVSTEMGKVWGGIKSAFGTLAGILEDVLNLPEGTITEPLSAALETVRGYFGQIWDAITGVFGTLGEIVKGLLSGEITPGEALTQAIEAVKGYFSQVWEAAAGAFGSLASILENVLGLDESTISGPLNSAIEAVKGYFAQVWEAITGVFGTLGDIIGKLLRGEINVQEALTSAIEAVKGYFTQVWEAIKSVFGTLGSIIAGIFGESDLGTKAQAAWDGVKDSVTSVFGGVWKAIIGSFGSLSEWFGGIWNGVNSAISNAWATVKDSVGGTISGIWSEITSWFGGEGEGSATHESSGGMQRAGGGARFSTPESALGDQVVNQALTSVAGNVQGSTPDVTAAMTAAMQAALDAAGALLTAEAGAAIGTGWMGGVADGINNAEDDVTGEASGMIQKAEKAMRTLINSGIFTRIGLAISEGVAVGIRSGTGAIISAAREASRQAYTASKVELDVRSPSHKMQWIGEQGGEGLAVGLENKRERIAAASRTLSYEAMTNVQTAHGTTPIDYGQLGDATAAALRREGVGDHSIDYDRMGAAVAQANKEAGVGKATIMVGKREMGRSLEPEVNTATAQRSSATIAGRPGQLVMV